MPRVGLDRPPAHPKLTDNHDGGTDMNDIGDASCKPVETPKGPWLTPGVGAVAAASFFSDSGHEATTSALPVFLTGTLVASAAALGVIDGISDALIGVMKLIGGPLANDPHRRARIASGGYLGTAVGDRGDRCGGHRVAGRWAACDRLVVPWFAVSGPRCVTGLSLPNISAGQGIRARKGPATTSARSLARCWRPA